MMLHNRLHKKHSRYERYMWIKTMQLSGIMTCLLCSDHQCLVFGGAMTVCDVKRELEETFEIKFSKTFISSSDC